MQVLAPADALRAALLRRVAAWPWLRPWLAGRDRRLALVLSGAVAVAFALSIVAPTLVYLVSPIVLGVPHLASDVRHLVLRAGLARRALFAVGGWCLVLVALRLAELRGAAFAAAGRAEWLIAGIGVGVAVVGAARGRPGTKWRAGLALAGAGLLFTLAALDPPAARLVLLHVHNPLALVLWLVVFRRRRLGVSWLPVGLLAAATLLLLRGETFGWVLAAGGHHALGVHLLAITDSLAPGSGAFGVSLTLAFVFWQSVHYALWLQVIPTEVAGSRSFRQSWRALVRDFTPAGLAAIALASAVLLACALGALDRTREVYLFLAGFHAYLELAALGAFWVTSGGAGRARRGAPAQRERTPAAG